MTTPISTYLLLALAAFGAGALNAVAGGGTLLTFPTLTAVISAAEANVTSTVALLPGSLAGAWGYRRELTGARTLLIRLLPPSLIGGGVGALLLLAAPDRFGELVPWLILSTGLLFLAQKPLTRLLKRRAATTANAEAESPPAWLVLTLIAAQLGIAIYGGYFGAGIGILMLTALGFMGVANIHKANAVKTVLASTINITSALVFGFAGNVRWDFAAVMALASILGGYGGARGARLLPPWVIRWAVIGIAFGLALLYFARNS